MRALNVPWYRSHARVANALRYVTAPASLGVLSRTIVRVRVRVTGRLVWVRS